MYLYLIIRESYFFPTIDLLKFLSTHPEAFLEGLLAGLSCAALAVGGLAIHSAPTFPLSSRRRPYVPITVLHYGFRFHWAEPMKDPCLTGIKVENVHVSVKNLSPIILLPNLDGEGVEF